MFQLAHGVIPCSVEYAIAALAGAVGLGTLGLALRYYAWRIRAILDTIANHLGL